MSNYFAPTFCIAMSQLWCATYFITDKGSFFTVGLAALWLIASILEARRIA